MNVKAAIVLVLGFSSFWNVACANIMEKFPQPPRTQSWWVAKGNVHNGHEVFIKRFKSSESVLEVTDFYRHAWHSDTDVPGYMHNEKDGWHLISHLVPDYQWVVQVKPASAGRGSEGTLSAMKLVGTGSVRIHRQREFTESLRGGNLLSSTESSKPTTARTQVHLYPGGAKRVASQFKSHMVSTGWSLQDEYTHQRTVTQRFEKAKRQIDVALVTHKGGKTLVFFNEVLHREN